MKNTEFQDQVYKELCAAFARMESQAIVMHTDLFRIRFAQRGIPLQQQLADLFRIISASAAGKTLLFPTFNYDFCRSRIYDVIKDPCQVGTFNEYVRQTHPEQRTLTPVFNYSICNNRNFSLEPAENPFAKDSTFAEMVKNRAAITFLGAAFPANTFIHYVEETADIGYRYLKTFAGSIRCYDKETDVTLKYRVRPLQEGAVDYDWSRLATNLFENNILKTNHVAGGELLWFYADQLLDYWLKQLKKDELYLLTPASRQKTLELYDQYGSPLKFETVEKQSHISQQ